jgi:HD-GYP domain-containing protein (c-di-GMP phosphodiesterase class II)
MIKKDYAMLNRSPVDLPGTLGLPFNPGKLLRDSSLQPEPDFDKAIQGFSAALNDLKEIVKDLACRQDHEATATAQYQTMDLHYRELFAGAPGGYLVTDTDGTIQESNQAAADMLQGHTDFLPGKPLCFFVSKKDHEAFYSLMDHMQQGREIKEIKVHVSPPGATPLPVCLAIAGRRNPAGELVGFNWLMHSLTPGLQDEEVLQSELTQLKFYFTELVQVFSAATEMQDPYAAGHQRRVACLSVALGQEMGFSPDRVEGLKITGFLHDIGKVAIPSDILTKTGLLTIVEGNAVKTHPQLGYDLLKHIEFPWPVAQAVLQHHERWNGSGYPAKLSGNDIILEARILAVADVVEAMVSPRPYGTAVGIQEALEELYQERGTLYDTQVVDACLKLFVEKGFKFN